MDFKKHLEKSWDLTLEHIVPLILMTIVMVFTSIITLGIFAPVTMAGYMQAILLMTREGREPKIQDIFSQMRLFLPLLGFSLLAVIAIFVGTAMMVLPGLLIGLAIAYGCLYLIPLMTDKNLRLTDAVRESISLSLKGNPAEHAIVVILFMGISWIGSCTVIGWVFTEPLATVFLMLVYEKRKSELPLQQKEE